MNQGSFLGLQTANYMLKFTDVSLKLQDHGAMIREIVLRKS